MYCFNRLYLAVTESVRDALQQPGYFEAPAAMEQLDVGFAQLYFDALRALDKSEMLKSALGAEVVASYLKLKRDDWNAYAGHLTELERQTTLDC